MKRLRRLKKHDSTFLDSLAPVDHRSSAGRRLDMKSLLSIYSAPTAVVTGGASLNPLPVGRGRSRKVLFVFFLRRLGSFLSGATARDTTAFGASDAS